MHFLILVCRRQLRQALSKQLDDTPREIDMLHWVSRGIFETVGQTIVGCSFDSLVEPTCHPMERAIKSLVYALCSGRLTRPRN